MLGEDNPQGPGPGLDKGCPLCSCASPALLQPGARSLEVHPPSLPSGTEPPKGSSPGPSPLPALRMLKETRAHLGPGSGTEGSQDLQTPLCLRLSLNLSPTGLLAGRREWPEVGGRQGVLGGGAGAADWGRSVPAPCPCALSSWCRTGAELKNI